MLLHYLELTPAKDLGYVGGGMPTTEEEARSFAENVADPSKHLRENGGESALNSPGKAWHDIEFKKCADGHDSFLGAYCSGVPPSQAIVSQSIPKPSTQPRAKFSRIWRSSTQPRA